MPLSEDVSIDESELSLMREIAREPIQTQRDLSRGAGLSLGMTNLLLKRLARKGLIKARQLDWKRTQHLLTPRGTLEKTRKTYDYARYTVRLFRQLRENVETVLLREHDSGRRVFWIVAQDEFEDLLRETIDALALAGAEARFAARFRELPHSVDFALTATQESAPSRPGLRLISLVDFFDARSRLTATPPPPEDRA